MIAAVAARVTGQPCKLRLDRDDDMAITGKRHDFRIDWSVGFDKSGMIRAVDIDLNARCGCSADLSQGVVDRAMFHSDNAYFLPAFRINSRRVKTNTVSNTAFRGFGGPQGMMGIERVIDAVAWRLNRDPLDIRKINLYGPGRKKEKKKKKEIKKKERKKERKKKKKERQKKERKRKKERKKERKKKKKLAATLQRNARARKTRTKKKKKKRAAAKEERRKREEENARESALAKKKKAEEDEEETGKTR